MTFTKTSAVLGALALASSANAHGYISGIIADGT